MNNKLRSSLIVLSLVAAMSVAKLVFFVISQSLAVWSELWHSLSDCATTALVVATFWLKIKSQQQPAGESGARQSIWQRFLHLCSRPKFEPVVSLMIALILMVVSISIIYQAAFGNRFVVQQPIVCGLGFIVLSACSYFIYRFEGLTAEGESSSALKADSLHNRADMLVSLMTGFSLLLYYFGVNVDRYAGGLIGLFVFSFALELVVNTVRFLRAGAQDPVEQLNFLAIMGALFTKKFWHRLGGAIGQKCFRGPRMARFWQGVGRTLHFIGYYGVRLVIVGAVAAYLGTAFYSIDVAEEGLLFRFGTLVNNAPIQPGLHIKWPWPVDRVEKVASRRIICLHPGNDAFEHIPAKIKSIPKARLWSIDHGDSVQFITGDNNLFLPTLLVHYHVKDPLGNSLSQANSGKLLQNIALQLATRNFAANDFYTISLYGHSQWLRKMETELQAEADKSGLGVQIDGVMLAGSHPPTMISSSFERVVAAYQEKETAVNLANKTMTSDLATARVAAYKKTSEAQIDHDTRLARSEGEAESYTLQAGEYRLAPDILGRYKKLETAGEVLSKKDLFLFDERVNISNDLLYYSIFGKNL